MKASEIRELSDTELEHKLDEARTELFNLRFQFATGQLDNPMRLKQVKRDIARIQTVRRERELNIDVSIKEKPKARKLKEPKESEVKSKAGEKRTQKREASFKRKSTKISKKARAS